VTGKARTRRPTASAIAFAMAGGKLCRPPSLPSLAPNGPSGSMLSTSVTAIGGDSVMPGMR
jgi:hypothetical protein